MYRHFFSSLVALCVLTGSAWSQTTDAVPLKNWHAPLAWQATSADEVAAAKEASSRRGESQPQVTTPDGLTTLGLLVAITPCRLVDTRQSWATPFGGGASAPLAWAAGSTTTIPAPSGSCSLPAAMAYSANITVIPSGSDVRWLTAFPTGATMPVIATLTGYEGGIVSNAAVIPADPTGSFNVYVKDATEVVIDVNGYYISPSALALGAGTAAAPSLTFGTDATTGLYSTGSGEISIAASGSDVANVNSTGLSVTGNLDFGGLITLAGSPFIQNYAFGGVSGNSSVAVGLGAATGRGENTVLGTGALSSRAESYNTAVGWNAGSRFSAGQGRNVAVGAMALYGNGEDDPHSGYHTAVGSQALYQLGEGQDDTALGYNAGYNATRGDWNTYVGARAGGCSPGTNATGGGNTFVGASAGCSTTGISNTFVGDNAGVNATTGSYNIFIANQGTGNPDTESNTIRIGDSNQSYTFISGISGTTTGLSGALPVVIDANGQLGTVSSSRRFKTDIADMGDTTETLMSLRPVQFRYVAHGPDSPLQYGLIAEEVAEVAPELVAHDANGEIETVFYDKVNAMLLNQVQTQQRLIEKLAARLTNLESGRK